MDEATQRKYSIKCKVKYHERWNNDGIRNALVKLVLLVPEDSDQRTLFLKAWLPAMSTQRVEVTGFIPNPKIDSPCRFLVRRADDRSDRHYLQIMSKGVADDIIAKLKEGDRLLIKIGSEADDEDADNSRESGGSFDLDTRAE